MQWIHAIINFMKKKFNLLIGDLTAERIKKEIGSAIPTGSEKTFLMKGRDIRTGTPKEVILTEKDTAEALEGVVSQIVNAVKHALENTPPELSSDLVDLGMVLAGGGAYLKNSDKLIKKETRITSYYCRRCIIMCCNWNRQGFRARRNIFFYANFILKSYI
jgi:rod shape-determining protein MreB